MAFNAHARKEQAEIEGNDLFERHCRMQVGLMAAKIGWNGNKAGQNFLWDLDTCQLLLTGVWVMNQGGHVEAEIADEWKWMGRIYRQGR